MSTLERLRSELAGRYDVRAEIAHGGSAWVFSALDVKHAREVALKVLRPELAASIGKERFLREIRVEAGLQHPNILPLFDSGEVDGLPFFVMPLVRGETLRTRLDRERRLGVSEAVRITRQLCDALAYAHSRGIVHRDVKPENVLLEDGRVLLADFGIARAIWQATQDRYTGSGVAIGTAAYMSPEQGLAEQVVDGRSDQYSLACVLYEMLSGSPPHSGGNAVQLVARRAATPAESVRTTRSEVPEALDRTLMRALSLDVGDRWPDIAAFGDALDTGSSVGSPRARQRPLARRAGVFVLALVAAGAIVWRAVIPRGLELDPQLLVVLPFTHENGLVDSVLNGDDCSRLLLDAIAEWRGVRLVDDMRVRDARRRLGRAPRELNEALQTASALGAGLAVWGLVEPAPDGATATVVRLVLYDVNDGAEKASARATIGTGSDIPATFAQLADTLLTSSIGAVGERRLPETRNFESLHAYVRGHRALDRWDLPAARTAFASAASLDPDNAMAHLWHAQSASWMRDVSPVEWGQAALRALRAARLTPRDSARAKALYDLSQGQFVAACDVYRELTRADALDFVAWFGLGECLTSDPVVERDSTTRSGWRFRTSVHEALEAHRRAIELVPSFPSAFGQAAYQRLSRYLAVDARRYRPGVSLGDSTRFAALPELAGDTLTYIPFPERWVFAESSATVPATYSSALSRNRSLLRDVTRAWVRADSTNPLSFEALARAREASGELATVRDAAAPMDLTALQAIRRARELSAGDDAVRTAVIEARILLKLQQWEAARSLADSLVTFWRERATSAPNAEWLSGPAVLLGDTRHAMGWARAAIKPRDPTRPGFEIPIPAEVAAAEALVYAAVGGPPDSTRAALLRAERSLALAPTRAVELARQLYLEWPATLAWPAVRPSWPTITSAGNWQLDAQRALDRADTAAAREVLQRIEAHAIRHRFSETGFDVVELTARLFLALRDTSNAVRFLDRSLDSVHESGFQLLEKLPETAGFIRSMALRAELAGRQGDLAKARELSNRVRTFWGRGDVFVQPTVAALERWR